MIDSSAFEQILEMDDDDDRDFSKGIVFGFFDQAVTTFDKMEKAMYVGSTSSLLPGTFSDTSHSSEKDLPELSSLGHFLKGSSATLGLTHVKDGCEKIQHFGAGKDETGTSDEPDKQVCVKNIADTLVDVKKAYFKVERFLRRYYGEEVPAEEEKEEKPAPKEESKEEKEQPKKEEEKEEAPKKAEETKK